MKAKIKHILFLTLMLAFFSASNLFAQKKTYAYSDTITFSMESSKGDIAKCVIDAQSDSKAEVLKRLENGEKERRIKFNKRKLGETLETLDIKKCELIKDQQKIETDSISSVTKKLDEEIGLIEEQQKTMDFSDLKKEQNEKLSSSSNAPNDAFGIKNYYNINKILIAITIILTISLFFLFRKNRKLNKELCELKRKNSGDNKNMTKEELISMFSKKSKEELANALEEYLGSLREGYEKQVDVHTKEHDLLVQAYYMYFNKTVPKEIINFLNSKPSNKTLEGSQQLQNNANVQMDKNLTAENNLSQFTETSSKSDLISQQGDSEIVQSEISQQSKSFNTLYFPMTSDNCFKASKGSSEFKDGVSLYRFDIFPEENKAKVYVVEGKQSVVTRIKNTPDPHTKVCDGVYANNRVNANKIITETPGSATLEGDKWRITDKVKIKYE